MLRSFKWGMVVAVVFWWWWWWRLVSLSNTNGRGLIWYGEGKGWKGAHTEGFKWYGGGEWGGVAEGRGMVESDMFQGGGLVGKGA